MLVAFACSCSKHESSSQRADVQHRISENKATSSKALTRLYWPLDHTPQQKQTVLPGFPQYRVMVITTCLNDSAVSNPITLDTGPALDVSHNYESDLLVSKNGRPWQRARLTKAIFQGNAAAQKLGPLASLALSSTAFLAYKKPDFLFYTRLGIPDSDVFVEATVALQPDKGLRLVEVREPKTSAE